MRLVFIGPPGAGKGTQSARLASELKIPHLSTGDMLREACRSQSHIGMKACLMMEAGNLVPDGMVHDIIDERISEKDCQGGYILDGFPRTVRQAEDFDELLHCRQATLDAVINIHVDKQNLLLRLNARGRQDDDTSIISTRLEQYKTLTLPLLDYYQEHGILHTVDGNPTEQEVYSAILGITQKLSASNKTDKSPE